MNADDTGALRRRPDAGGYARGEETRARIIAAALKVFGDQGYARASTRQIAAEAGVNPPALQYYFDSKEGLHRACGQFIIDRVNQALAPTLEAAEAAVATKTPERALEALTDLLDALVDLALTSTDTQGRWRFMAHGQTDGAGPAFALFRDDLLRPVHAAVCRLVGVVIGRAPADEETRLRTTTVLSQLKAFQINYENTLVVMAWSDYGGGRIAAIKSVLRAHTRAALTAAGMDSGQHD